MYAFLLIGQSNMSGRGSLAELTDISRENIFVLREEGWEKAVEPVVRDRPFSAQGLSLTFANCVHMLTGEDIGLIPASLGGSPIKDWQPGEALFENAVAAAERAVSMGAKLAGILWHQGESDSLRKEDVSVYRERLSAMTEEIKKRTDALKEAYPDGVLSPLPFLMGELGGYLDRNPDSLYHREVNEIMHAFVKDKPEFAVTKANDLKDKGDLLHFSTLSLRRLGLRYANLWADIVFSNEKSCPDGTVGEYL